MSERLAGKIAIVTGAGCVGPGWGNVGGSAPGGPAVPGCVRAQRFLNPDGGPHSLACYDLTDCATLESPPWLAVRHTAWSDRVRPHFRDTRRTMFRSLPNTS